MLLRKIKPHQVIKIFQQRVFLGKFFKDFPFGHHLDLKVFGISFVKNLNGKIMDLCFKMIKKFTAYLIEFHFCGIRREQYRNLIFTGFQELKGFNGVENKRIFPLKLLQHKVPFCLEIGFGKMILGKVFRFYGNHFFLNNIIFFI